MQKMFLFPLRRTAAIYLGQLRNYWHSFWHILEYILSEWFRSFYLRSANLRATRSTSNITCFSELPMRTSTL